jgi:hypothetical protein
MQPAETEVVQNLTLPASAASASDFFAGHHVDPLMRAAGARVTEVVGVAGRAEDREDDRLRRAAGPRGRRRGQQAGHEEEEEDSSGCRPVASHELRFALDGVAPMPLIPVCCTSTSFFRSRRRGRSAAP